MEQMALLLAIDHLLGRQGGQCLGVPVYHAQSTIDQSLVIKVYEHLDHTLRALLIHGEGGAVPVAAGTQTAQLLQDDAPMLIRPFPRMLQELLACQVMLLDALFRQFLHHLSLCSDGGMVGARHPQGVLTLHTGTTHQNVLDGVVQHMAHVQHTCYIGRWDDNRVGLTTIGF